ncbi:MAG: SpoIIE family protein phosphatase [Chthoniobacter sp.]|nr:SpoIIE family protein phosphatase [Chthoniobacter sp.]
MKAVNSKDSVRVPIARDDLKRQYANSAPVQPATTEATSKSLRAHILLVANQTKYLKSATKALEKEGHIVATACDAEQAVAQILARRPDLMLIGKLLRGMDGFMLAMHLKADPGTRDIRIVAWTESESARVQQTAAAAGFDGYIQKSLNADTLPADVAQFLGEAASLGRVGRNPQNKLNVLIVDDNALGRELLIALLQMEEYTLFEAEDGVEALTILEERKIDAVISDVLMPTMDGYQLCHKIRADQRFKDVPVIIYSGTLTSAESESLAAELGAVRFLRKPAPLHTICTTLREVIEEAEQRREGASGAEGVVPGPNENERRLIECLEKQNRDFHEVTGKLLQKHHDLILLTRAFSRSEETLRKKNAEFEEDLRLAREAQMALLPRGFPSFPRGTPPQESALRFHHRYDPRHSVGGDFFDVPMVSDTKAGLFISDVMGHGVRAALMTAVIRGIVAQFAATVPDPAMVLAEINRVLLPILRQAGTPMFASAFYMVVDAATGETHFANAGHPSPLLIRRQTGEIERLGLPGRAHGPALGMLENAVYRSGTQDLASGDMVIMFTDGIFEVDGPNEEPFGQKRLVEAVRRRISLSPGQIFNEVIDEIHKFAVKEEFEDDVCLLGMEVDHLC